MRAEFAELLVQSYSHVKSQYPNEGRRKHKLRVIQEFWTSNPTPPTKEGSLAPQDDPTKDESDIYDSKRNEGGIVVRTDFSNDSAWDTFVVRAKEFGQEFAQLAEEEEEESSEEEDQSVEPSKEDVKMEVDEGSDEDDQEEPLIIFLDTKSPVFSNISNLAALRLLNDVDIRPAPTPPEGTQRISPGNRLVDLNGWQEIYSGRNIWIYDSRSNEDMTLRVVSQEGDIYGTATGDSWRTQVSHIWELQWSMTTGGMKINFGGMDRWDYNERKRNLDEANTV